MREPAEVWYARASRWIPLAIALLTFLTFSPSLWNDFVHWDDDVNITNNLEYRGLAWAQLRWMLTAIVLGHYVPLTWLSFGFDYVVWGMNPVGYHLTNLLLHSANAAWFYLVAWRLLSRATTWAGGPLRLAASVAALFFAVHPLRAESVAWVTERRDVLSAFFFLLTILTYLRAAEADGLPRRRLLAVSVGCYVAALASKAMVMTLPVVLVLLDVYPLRRVTGGWRAWVAPSGRRVGVEKLPYLMLGLASAALSYYVVAVHAILTPAEQYPWVARVGMVFSSLWFYVMKTVLPLGLSPLYELPPEVNPTDPRFLVSAVGVLGVTAIVFLLRRRWPAGLAVWAYYAIVLSPVIGVVHAGLQLEADRYSYLSCLGWALIVGAGAGVATRARQSGALRPAFSRLAVAGAVIWIGGLGVLTWQQVQIWRDTGRLWLYAVSVEPGCATCHDNLGMWLLEEGLPRQAFEHFSRALGLRPDRVQTHAHLGMALARLGLWARAADHYRLVIARYPDAVGVLSDLGAALTRLGRPAEAAAHLRQAMLIKPDDLSVRVNLGFALNALGEPGEAAAHFQRAVELKPSAGLPRLGLIQAYLALGQMDLARAEYDGLQTLNPGMAAAVSDAFPRE